MISSMLPLGKVTLWWSLVHCCPSALACTVATAQDGFASVQCIWVPLSLWWDCKSTNPLDTGDILAQLVLTEHCNLKVQYPEFQTSDSIWLGTTVLPLSSIRRECHQAHGSQGHCSSLRPSLLAQLTWGWGARVSTPPSEWLAPLPRGKHRDGHFSQVNGISCFSVCCWPCSCPLSTLCERKRKKEAKKLLFVPSTPALNRKSKLCESRFGKEIRVGLKLGRGREGR